MKKIAKRILKVCCPHLGTGQSLFNRAPIAPSHPRAQIPINRCNKASPGE